MTVDLMAVVQVTIIQMTVVVFHDFSDLKTKKGEILVIMNFPSTVMKGNAFFAMIYL